MELGKAGENDSASASYGTTYCDGRTWHMFYLGTPHASPAPTSGARLPLSDHEGRQPRGPPGPWTKQKRSGPLPGDTGHLLLRDRQPQPRSSGRTASTACSSARRRDHPIRRTLSIARTKNLDGPWTPAPEPDPACEASRWRTPRSTTRRRTRPGSCSPTTWGSTGFEYTDAVWVYWSKDLNNWDPDHKAVVLDRSNCSWSKYIVGPALGASATATGWPCSTMATRRPRWPAGVKSHMHRDIGLAWLQHPLTPPGPAR